jgi:hypothetical protein
MKTSCFNRIGVLAGTLVLALCTAAPYAYGGAYHNSFGNTDCATWGCGTVQMNIGGEFPNYVEYTQGGSQDIKHDYNCVYISYIYYHGRGWPGYPDWSTRSCTTAWKSNPAWIVGWFPDDVTKGVRLYRDDGRYLTIWGL